VGEGPMQTSGQGGRRIIIIITHTTTKRSCNTKSKRRGVGEDVDSHLSLCAAVLALNDCTFSFFFFY